MTKIYITITGTNFRFGSEWIKQGSIIKLIKDYNNEYDTEAIYAEVEGLGKIGYVANSVKTVEGECYSAGRLYDKIGEEAEAKVKYVLDNGAVICKVKDKSLI